ncbi:hypothetical protein IGB42_02647 [Andreprevotia sp. IGB-42]|uniref:hypothetical protein n=1 Tax=Andreprevotia sp. IGB-42 TaxID=2497473 RepID=UPI00135892A2|nr:hypothetical protein [Andreprevotia sp. IGB-42]KAF0812804.1 hypothetical protein IGB42_02647 [Andreprevotia sp. IGB-42]
MMHIPFNKPLKDRRNGDLVVFYDGPDAYTRSADAFQAQLEAEHAAAEAARAEAANAAKPVKHRHSADQHFNWHRAEVKKPAMMLCGYGIPCKD